MAVLTEQAIDTFRMLDARELRIVMNLANDLIAEREYKTDAEKWFLETREKMLKTNPMSMDEIDRIIHE